MGSECKLWLDVADDVDLCFLLRKDRRNEWNTEEDLLGVILEEWSSSESDNEPLTTGGEEEEVHVEREKEEERKEREERIVDKEGDIQYTYMYIYVQHILSDFL